jgi:hypothetical protein
MQIAMVGLGRMGANMVRRLLRGGRDCSAYDVSPRAVERLVGGGARGAASLPYRAGPWGPDAAAVLSGQHGWSSVPRPAGAPRGRAGVGGASPGPR